MDFNDGRPVWHASVAILDYEKGRTMLASEASPSTRRMMIRSAKAFLAGVGQLPSSVEQMELAIHYRRAITDEELAGLPQSWRCIPAVHEAGRGIVLEENT